MVAAKIPEISWKKNEQMDCPTITWEKHVAVVDLLNKKLAKEAENYPRRDFGEKFNQKYQNILKKAEKRKAELESNGQKVTLVREEPFAVARDSVDFKVYLMIWKEKQGDRVAEIEEF